MSQSTIHWTDENDTIEFAAEELKHYVEEISGSAVTLQNGDAVEPDYQLGLTSQFPSIEPPETSNDYTEDGIAIETEGQEGIITGTNPRSVLSAVYRYLRELGCEWVRPGENGEIIPSRPITDEITIRELPAYRHRGLEIGVDNGDQIERSLDLIDWAPKVGYNSVMIEFFEGDIFKLNRSRRRDDPLTLSEALTHQEAFDRYQQCLEAIRKRDLMLHSGGHGWNAKVLEADVAHEGEWAARVLGVTDEEVPGSGVSLDEDRLKHAAKIDGERKLLRGIPINTELCYSNPETRSEVVSEVVDYAGEHPEIDFLHVWLADDYNNHCECEECRQLRPSDWYVKTLNQLDDALSEADIDTNIVVMIYVDVFWPPLQEQLNQSDRFSLMFAPIGRNYSDSYASVRTDDLSDSLPEYERNAVELPKTAETNVAFLSGWVDIFEGDTMLWDYHYFAEQFNDPGEMELAQTTANDIQSLDVTTDRSV